MLPLTKLKLAVILPLTLALTSCQGLPFPAGSSASKHYTAADIARMYPPILLHDGDQLTRGSACEIIEHNVTFYCENPASRPAGFPSVQLCVAGAKPCDLILGEPSQPSSPSPSASGMPV